MNCSIIRYILGYVLKIEAVLLLLPCLVGVIYKEDVAIYYLGTAFICLLTGFALSYKKPSSTLFYLKEGCIATALSWIVLSFFGCLPFWLSKEIPSFTNALFETISGFTTTGASILEDVEALSHAALFWRSFSHWIGGMGVLVFLLAVFPLAGGSSMHLMKAESPGPSVSKLVPKTKHSARILYFIYLGITLVEFIFLVIGKMPVFDAVTTTLGTAGTGGFAINADSFAGYSTYLQWVVTIFMILFGVNFNAYYYILMGEAKKIFNMEEVRYYFIIIISSIVLISVNIFNTCSSVFEALTHASFQTASVITTTGFASTDFNLWPEASKTILVLLMFVGACAGSTGGGMKVSRFVIAFKTVVKELNSYIHPKSIQKLKIDDKQLPHEVVRVVNVYFMTFMLIFFTSFLIISFDGNDFITNFTSIATTINNIGPGLQKVGPAGNFNFFSPLSKYVLMFDMLAGRLELFPLLLLFHPVIWKDLIAQKLKSKRK